MSRLRLGWVLARRGRSWGRVVAMALGFMAAGFVAAALVDLPAIFDGRNARAAARSGFDATSWDQPMGGGTVRRTIVSSTGVAPAGVELLPGPGELVWSPALRDLAERDPLVAQSFPQRAIGLVGAAGLIEPGERVVYVGVPGDGTERGERDGTVELAGSREVRAVVGFAAVFLALPAGAFLATSARLSARARERRLASLRLLGLRRRDARLVNAVETALMAAAGSLAGVAAWAIVQPALGRRGVGTFRWFAADAPVAIPQATAIVAVATAAAIVIATVVANGAVDEPMGARRSAPARVRTAWRAAVLLTGAALLFGCARRTSVDPTALALLLAGGSLSIVGVALATPLVSRAMGHLLGRSGGARRLLLARRLTHEPAAAGRIMAGLLVATFTLGVAQGVIGAFRDAETTSGDDWFRGVQSTLPRRAIEALPGVEVVIPRSSDGWAATCAELRALLAQPIPGCIDGERFELAPAGVAGGGTSGLPIVAIEWPNDRSSLPTGPVVPPAMADARGAGAWAVRVDPELQPRFDAALLAADPAAFGGRWGETGELADMVVAAVIAGAVASLALGLGAVVVATADRAVERQALDTNLLAVGVPAQVLRLTQSMAAILPVVANVALAAVIGGLTGHLYRRGGNGADATTPFPWRPIGISITAGLAGAVLAGGAAFLLTRTRLAPGHLRAV